MTLRVSSDERLFFVPDDATEMTDLQSERIVHLDR